MLAGDPTPDIKSWGSERARLAALSPHVEGCWWPWTPPAPCCLSRPRSAGQCGRDTCELRSSVRQTLGFRGNLTNYSQTKGGKCKFGKNFDSPQCPEHERPEGDTAVLRTGRKPHILPLRHTGRACLRRWQGSGTGAVPPEASQPPTSGATETTHLGSEAPKTP